MTALPDPNEFITTLGVSSANGMPLHPDVRERYWGYEVRTTQVTNARATCIRMVSIGMGLVFGVFGIAALVLPMPAYSGVAGAQWAIAVTSLCLAALAAHVSSLHRVVRVQVDTAAGELREVVDGRLGAEVILARYGMDAVAAVEIVVSERDRTLGQVQVRVNGHGVVPIGDGAVSVLGPLRDQLMMDCGLAGRNAPPAVWSGPLDN